MLGNHEGLPCDQFDIFGGDHQWVLDQLSEYWRPWLTDECNFFLKIFINLAYDTFKTYGYYSQLHPGTNLRMIVLNTFPYDTMNAMIWQNTTHPINQVSHP